MGLNPDSVGMQLLETLEDFERSTRHFIEQYSRRQTCRNCKKSAKNFENSKHESVIEFMTLNDRFFQAEDIVPQLDELCKKIIAHQSELQECVDKVIVKKAQLQEKLDIVFSITGAIINPNMFENLAKYGNEHVWMKEFNPHLLKKILSYLKEPSSEIDREYILRELSIMSTSIVRKPLMSLVIADQAIDINHLPNSLPEIFEIEMELRTRLNDTYDLLARVRKLKEALQEILKNPC